jgi:hypothetical protein
MEYIELGENENLLKLGIRTKDGVDTGETLEFNLKDIELLDKLQKMRDDNKKNHQWINSQLVIIDKKQDFRKKDQLMSNNEKLKYEAIKTFYKKEKEVYDLFLGEGGVDKLLYGRPLEWTTLREIDKIIETQIAPKLDINMDNIVKEIKQKYTSTKEEESVLE